MAYHFSPLLIAYFALMGYMVWMMIVGTRALSASSGSYLVHEQGGVMQFRFPEGRRRICRLAAVLFALMSAVFLLMTRHAANPIPIFFFTVPDGLLLMAFFLYMSGPNDVRLYGERRVYEQTVGWPWRPVTRTGNFDDIRGLCVSPNGNVLLLLRRRDLIRKGIVIGSGLGRASAEVLAEKISRTTGIPIVDYPKG